MTCYDFAVARSPLLQFHDPSGASPPPAFGAYRVLHQIGSGVLGPVFRAYDDTRDRLVAVKTFQLDLVPESASALVERLRATCTPLAPIRGVVEAVDAGLAGTTPYLVCRFADGEALDAVWRRAATPNPGAILTRVAAVATAIDAAWDAGVGHGRLHPRDIFINDDGAVEVTGFGIAAALESVGVRPAPRRPFAAPERSDAEWDRRADAYALAAIADQWLSLRCGNDYPAAWRTVLERARHEDPSQRYASATAMVDALREALPARAPAEVVAAAPEAPVVDLPPSQMHRDHPGPSVDVAQRLVLDAPPEPRTFAVTRSQDRRPFPWAAVAAVLIAGVAIGLVAGYQLGLRQGTPDGGPVDDAPVSHASASPGAAEAGAPVAQVPPPAPEVRQASLATAPAAVLGTLRVETRPAGARVVVDGGAVGNTPVNVQRLTTGEHRVRIERPGYRTVVSTVRVVGGEETRLAVTLELLAGGGGQ